jgi:1-acyl-sn-glycerol-3-phosphate acyltransferase
VSDETDVDRGYSPRFSRAFGALMNVFCRIWFRYRMVGIERVPKEACLFAGNHSGIGIADILCLFSVGPKYFPARRFVGMMHDLFIKFPIVGHASRAMGAVRAHPDAARAALAKGYDLVVFPGGNIDSCRPFHRARDVNFGPRRGYIRIALASGVKIVPLATRGSHYTYLLLPWIGMAIGRLVRKTGLTRDDLVPIPFAVPVTIGVDVLVGMHILGPMWLLYVALYLILPNPVSITTTVLEPIDVCAQTAHIADEKERIEAAHALVLTALQDAVRISARGDTRR